MALIDIAPWSKDPETRALRALARANRSLPKRHRPDDALQIVCDLARSLTDATYAALAITDDRNNTEGFMVSGLDGATLNALKTPPQGHGPLGSLRYDGRPVRYENIDEHARSFGFPSNHPEMKQLMGVAIWSGAEVRGALYVTDPHGSRMFDDHDEELLLTLAKHASKIVETEWY
tara:strand:- start:989 stop:1516 length:528 start_codon:yes stop_codon:yes gene_type:complete